MSYILEALKKAQAERELGVTPGIASVPVHAPKAAPKAAQARWFALGSAALLAAAIAAWLAMRPREAVVLPPPAPAPAVAPAPAPVAKAAPAPVPAPAPAPVVRKPVVAKPAAPVAVAAADPDESLPLATELPPGVQQSLPQVSFGGYMYSSNPADRLLLIDKVLRKEGDTVAPGLILERLMPKCAVLNYRGTRYRVPY